MALVAVRLFVSIGCQWFFGFLLYVLEDDVIVEYLFVCTTSLQGTFCFVGIVTTRLVRRRLKAWINQHIQRVRVQPTVVTADPKVRGSYENKRMAVNENEDNEF